jgi:tetratricopeptide (TPR) repeat protein
MPDLLSCVLLTALALGPAPAEDAAALYARAVSLHRAGDLEGAVKAYREVVALDPRNPEVRSNLGAALAALGRYEEAIDSYRAALAVAPANVRIRLNLALAYYKSAEIALAAEELESVHVATPGDRQATLLLADCRLRLGEYGKVEALLRPLESEHPDDRAVLYLLGMALIRDGKPGEGQQRVERLLRSGDSAEAHYLLGSASFMAGEYPRAVEDFAKALALDPELPLLRSYYGRALLFTGDAAAAERAFREVLAEDPNDYDASFYLASILARRGHADEARPLAERALQLRPHSEEARQLLASLDKPPPVPAAPEASPLVGRPAPDVELVRAGGGTLRLSSLRGRPVVLAIGSYTCPQLRHGARVLNQLHRRFGGRATFLMAYIREAHPAGGAWPSTINEREGVSLPEARDEAQRAEHAALCARRLEIPYEIALDGMDGRAETAFAAFPSRAFVIDASGKVTFATGLGEDALRPEALEAALEAALR